MSSATYNQYYVYPQIDIPPIIDVDINTMNLIRVEIHKQNENCNSTILELDIADKAFPLDLVLGKRYIPITITIDHSFIFNLEFQELIEKILRSPFSLGASSVFYNEYELSVCRFYSADSEDDFNIMF